MNQSRPSLLPGHSQQDATGHGSLEVTQNAHNMSVQIPSEEPRSEGSVNEDDLGLGSSSPETSLSMPPPQTSLSMPPPQTSLSMPPPQTSLSMPPPQTSLSMPPPQTSLSMPPPQTSLSMPPPQTSLSMPSPTDPGFGHARANTTR
ncbi:unnamed protein product [Gadus morhua 'NCC']